MARPTKSCPALISPVSLSCVMFCDNISGESCTLGSGREASKKKSARFHRADYVQCTQSPIVAGENKTNRINRECYYTVPSMLYLNSPCLFLRASRDLNLPWCFYLSLATMASVNCFVVALPPRSPVIALPSAIVCH